MKSRKIGAIVVVVLLVLGGSLLLPSSAEEGRENSLLYRVEVLEGQVVDLLARVEMLEGGGGNACACDVLNLEPLDDLPENPSEGDLCVRTCRFAPVNQIYCFLNGSWQRLLLTDQPICPGR